MSYFAPFPWNPDIIGMLVFLVIVAWFLGGWLNGGRK